MTKLSGKMMASEASGEKAAQRTRLSALASRVVAADARRRGIDIHATLTGDGS